MKVFAIIPLILCLSNGKIFIDELGNEVRVEKVERIVSLAPNITEIIFALGMGEKLVGVTDFCDYPEEAKKKEKIGGFINPNVEKIISLKPDLVIATKDGNDPVAIERIKNFKIPVFVIYPMDFEGVMRTILSISEILGVKEKGNILVKEMKRVAEETGMKIKGRKKKRVLLLYETSPMIASGPGTLADNLIKMAGGENVLSDSPLRYPKINLETAISRKPDVVIITEMKVGSESLKGIKEAFGGKVFLVKGDLINRAGPRLIYGLEEIFKILHPDEE